MLSLLLIYILISVKCVTCLHKQPCGDDDECFINAMIERVYPKLVAGMPGVATSDPLHLDNINADIPPISYNLSNANLTGLKDCNFVQLDYKRLTEYTLFDYAISCPVLTLQAGYDLDGLIQSKLVREKGLCKIVYVNYHISIEGKHEKVQDEKGRSHVHLLDYKVTPVLKGGVHPEYDNVLFNNDKSSHNHANDLEEMTRDLVMDAFMNKFIQNLKNFHQLVPIEDLHFKYVH